MINNPKIGEYIKNHRFVIIVLAIGFLLRLILSVQIYSGDVNNHISWGKDVLVNGLSGIYDKDFFPLYGTLTPTYPPIPIFMFTLSYWLFSVTYKLAWIFNLNFSFFPSNLIFFLEDQDTLPAFLKIPGILADIGLSLVVYAFIKKLFAEKKEYFARISLLLIVFNPALIYNSAYWGQIESVPLFFLLASFYSLFYSKKNIQSPILLTLALLTKQTTIIFIPLYALVYYLRNGWRNSAKGAAVSLIIFALAFLPFYKTGNIFIFPFATYWEKIQTGSGSDLVTDHAFNFWALTTGLGKISDSQKLGILSYKTWGYLIFTSLTITTIFYYKKKKQDTDWLITASFLVSLSAFLYLTRMHERYIIQSLPFLLLIWAESKKIIYTYLFLSLFALINMYNNWWAPRIDVLVYIFSNIYVINLLILAVIVLYVLFFLQYIRTGRINTKIHEN